MRTLTVRVGHANVACLNADEALAAILRYARSRDNHIVVTPNIHHIALLEKNKAFRKAYDEASLVLPDGWPVAMAAGVKTRSRLGRVTGSDLLRPLLIAAEATGLRLAIVGGAPGSESRTKALIAEAFPRLAIEQVVAPALDFTANMDGNSARIVERRAGHPADMLLLAFGTPQQEILAAEYRRRLNAGVVLCFGASLDFLLGDQVRAPGIMRAVGLEWLFRLLRDPRRLVRRYVFAVPGFISALISHRDQ